jgi:predicted Zn-dependent peptidase
MVADVSERRGVGLIKRHFGDRRNNRSELIPEDSSSQSVGNSALKGEKYVEMNTFQANCIAGTVAYDLFDKRRVPLALLANILGGPSLNSRLNLALREKHALAYSVDASYTPYTDAGLFTIYFGTDKSNIDQSLALIDKELSLLRNKLLSVNVLNAAKKQFLGQLAISGDNGENQCLAMGKSLLFYGEIESIGEIKEKIEAVDPSELLDIANELLDRDRMFTLVYS